MAEKKKPKSLDELDKKMDQNILEQAKKNAIASRVLDKSWKSGDRFVETSDVDEK